MSLFKLGIAKESERDVERPREVALDPGAGLIVVIERGVEANLGIDEMIDIVTEIEIEVLVTVIEMYGIAAMVTRM